MYYVSQSGLEKNYYFCEQIFRYEEIYSFDIDTLLCNEYGCCAE